MMLNDPGRLDAGRLASGLFDIRIIGDRGIHLTGAVQVRPLSKGPFTWGTPVRWIPPIGVIPTSG